MGIPGLRGLQTTGEIPSAPPSNGQPAFIIYRVPGTELIRPSGALSLQPSDGTPVLISQRNSERLTNLSEATQLVRGSTGI